MFYVVTFEQMKMRTLSAPQNDPLNPVFLKNCNLKCIFIIFTKPFSSECYQVGTGFQNADRLYPHNGRTHNNKTTVINISSAHDLCACVYYASRSRKGLAQYFTVCYNIKIFNMNLQTIVY